MTEFGLESIKARLTERELKQIAEEALRELRSREYSKLIQLESKCTVYEIEFDKTYPKYFIFCAVLETMKEGYTATQACRINELEYDYEEYDMIQEIHDIKKTVEYKRWASAKNTCKKRRAEFYERWGSNIWNQLLYNVNINANDWEKKSYFYGLKPVRCQDFSEKRSFFMDMAQC